MIADLRLEHLTRAAVWRGRPRQRVTLMAPKPCVMLGRSETQVP